jgi:DNA repair exonuclease SbcCD ATPase subunit
MTTEPPTQIETLRKSVNGRLHKLALARSRCKVERKSLEELLSKQEQIQTAVKISQEVAEAVQREAHSQIADVVSRSLEAVFDEPYTFQINFEQRRGRTEASLTFERDGLQVDPMTASGGGICDLGALALRLSCLLLSKPPLRKLLVLDEPLKFLGPAESRHRARMLIESLSEELGVQFLIITHLEEFHCGKVIQL